MKVGWEQDRGEGGVGTESIFDFKEGDLQRGGSHSLVLVLVRTWLSALSNPLFIFAPSCHDFY